MTELNKNDFDIANDEDEIRVDGLCRALLRKFHRSLLDAGAPPLEAGRLAHGADYFLRDYVVSARRENVFRESPGLVRRFAATWYIISTLEPAADELSGYLEGVAEFIRYLRRRGLVSASFLEAVEKECADLDYYRNRIEAFFAIEGDGYPAWEAGCTLK